MRRESKIEPRGKRQTKELTAKDQRGGIQCWDNMVREVKENQETVVTSRREFELRQD